MERKAAGEPAADAPEGPYLDRHDLLFSANLRTLTSTRHFAGSAEQFARDTLGSNVENRQTVLDLAALTSGRGLSDATRTAMTHAYVDAAGGDWSTWRQDLEAARLHLCVQWLGWSSRWTPPPEHRHDWLAEAVALEARR